MKYVIEIDGEYWYKFKTRSLGRWVKDTQKATVFDTTLITDRHQLWVYLKDWKRYGVRKKRVR